MTRFTTLLLSMSLLLVAAPVSPAFARDLDGDAIEDAMDSGEAELGLRNLSMRSRRNSVQVRVDGFIDLGVLGHGAQLEGLDDLSLTISGSDGDDLAASISADKCTVKRSGGLVCRAGKTRFKFKKVKGISSSASRYRVQARVVASGGGGLPGEPYEVTFTAGDTDWVGTIAAIDCRVRSRKAQCRAHRGIEKVPTIMAPVLVIHTPDGKLLERPLVAHETVSVGAHPGNDLVILDKSGVDLSRLQVEAKETETWVLDLLDSASGEARVMEAGEVMALGGSGEVTATLVYRSVTSQAESFVDLDRHRRHKKSGRSSGCEGCVAKPSRLIAFGDSITGAFGFYPNSMMMPANYLAFAFCSPPTGWPNSQCSNNAPAVYSPSNLEDHYSFTHRFWTAFGQIFNFHEDPGLTQFIDWNRVAVRDQEKSMTREDDNPLFAYVYQMQQMLRAAGDNTPVWNRGMSGATPAHWDPNCHGKNWVNLDAGSPLGIGDWRLTGTGCTWSGEKKDASIVGPAPSRGIYPSGGVFAKGCDLIGKGGKGVKVCGVFDYEEGDQNLVEASATTNERIALWDPIWKVESEDLNSNVTWVGTLGANPLLRRWMKVTKKGEPAYGDRVVSATCTASKANATKCMKEDLTAYEHQKHLEGALRYLLERGNVVVMKYYHTCFGLFGYRGRMSTVPTMSGACTSADAKIAYHITDMVNQTVHKAVVAVRGTTDPFATLSQGGHTRGYRIIEVCPGNVPMGSDGACHGRYWNDHGAWDSYSTSDDRHTTLNKHAWTAWNDTGMHPNPTGHAVLAASAMAGICQYLGFWCDIEDGRFTTAHNGAVKWAAGEDSHDCTGSTECAFFSVQNKTEVPLVLKKSYYAHNPETGYSYSDNEGRDAGDGKFLQFPLWRVEPNRTMRAMAQNHDDRPSGPTIQLEFEAGGGPIVFNVDSDSSYIRGDAEGTVAAYSSSPLFKIESLGSAVANNNSIVGNWRVVPRPETTETARWDVMKWSFSTRHESAHNKKYCEAAYGSDGSRYASYYSILNKGPEAIYLKNDPGEGQGGLTYGVWCVKPASVVPPGYATMAVIGDSGDGAYGTKGYVTWNIGSPSGREFKTYLKSQPSRQGDYETTGSLHSHGYSDSREASLCDLSCHLSPLCHSCSSSDTTIANLWVETSSTADTLLAVGAVCGNSLQGSQPGYACESLNADCGRMVGHTIGDYTYEYAAVCKGTGQVSCHCLCQRGMVERDGECVYPDCPTACASWGADSPVSDALERTAVCYRNAPGDFAGSCWAPLGLPDGTKACYKAIMPADSLCTPVP